MPRRIDPETAVAVMRAVGLEPLEPYPGANVAWRCYCVRHMHAVAPTLTSVRGGAISGCRHCGRIAAGERRRSAGQEKAEADMRAAGFEPLEPYPGARAKWRCLHTACGSVVRPRLTKIRAGGRGCLVCAGRAPVDPAAAEADMRAIGMEPLEPFPGRVADRWRCRCVRCGQTGAPTLNNVRRGQGGCCNCARLLRQSRPDRDRPELGVLEPGVPEPGIPEPGVPGQDRARADDRAPHQRGASGRVLRNTVVLDRRATRRP